MKKKNILFTVGPVESTDAVLEVGAQQVPYFRTAEFSAVMQENERYICTFADADEKSKAVFLTGSGTAAMEAACIYAFDEQDKVLIVNGGTFGQRFVDICKIHNIPYDELRLDAGITLDNSVLDSIDGTQYTGFLINMHETSTGVLYDMEIVSDFCKKYGIFLVVDCISSFLADPYSMQQTGTDIFLTSSQKALACPPGVSILVLSEQAITRVLSRDKKCLYLDLQAALVDAERGQTPFTPAVGTLLQLHARFREIETNGGVQAETNRIRRLAQDFRDRIAGLPYEIFSKSVSNAVTPLHPLNASPATIFKVLKDEYGIWVCPNGGDLRDKIFRVGHIGNLCPGDNTRLIEALKDIHTR